MGYRENQVQREIAVYLGAIQGLLFERINTGVAYDSTGRAVQFGVKGAPDNRVTWHGRSYAIECKSLTGKQTHEQIIWQRAFEAAGGTYILARSLDDVRKYFAQGA